jgi:hypothetical protein
VAHTFDTGLSVPQRRLLRDAIVTALAPMLRASGRYCDAVVAYDRPVKTGAEQEIGELIDTLNGRDPAIAVALGRQIFTPDGVRGDRGTHAGTITAFVYYLSRNLRSHMARVAGDVRSGQVDTADPGIEVMLEHGLEILTGAKVTDDSGTVHRLIPKDEDELETGADYSLWCQTFEVRVQRDRKLKKGVSQRVTTIVTTHDEHPDLTPDDHVLDGNPQNPLITSETEL